MKVTIKLPEGFRRLKEGELVKNGDYRLNCDDADSPFLEWIKLKGIIFSDGSKSYNFNIRRIVPKVIKVKKTFTTKGILIPKGYFQLKKGKLIKIGDKFWLADHWEETNNGKPNFPHFVGDSKSTGEYIRAKE